MVKFFFVSKKKLLVHGLKILPYVTQFVGFQTMVILDP